MNTLKQQLQNQFNAFFEDFGYSKKFEDACYVQKEKQCSKAIFLHLTEYEDGITVEFMLGISHEPTELSLNELSGNAHGAGLQLTLRLYLDAIDKTLPKRNFLKKTESPDYFANQIEAFFVNAGFYWLDEYSQTQKLSDLMALSIIQNKHYDNNILLMCQRSLLLKQFLGELITEDLFFTYYELLQEKKLPENQLKLFLERRNYFLSLNDN